MAITSSLEIKIKIWYKKIRRDSRSQLQLAIDEYKENKEVVILGKQENGKMTDIPELNIEQ